MELRTGPKDTGSSGDGAAFLGVARGSGSAP